MTFNKYKRLTIVLFLPLLILGILSVYLKPQIRSTVEVLCLPSSLTLLYCVSDLYQGKEHLDSLREQNRSDQIDVNVREGSNLIGMRRLDIHAFAFPLNAYIVGYSKGDNISSKALAKLSALPGTSAVLELGYVPIWMAAENVEDYHLLCHSLTLGQYSNEFNFDAKCFVEDNYYTIKFSSSDAQDVYIRILNKELSSIIDKMEADDRHEWFAKYLVQLPMPLYLYFLISGIVWILLRAIRYVRAG